MPSRLRKVNLELLQLTVLVVYYKIRLNQTGVEELDRLLEETKMKLNENIDDRETLSQDDTDVHSYFHDLLGGEKLVKLDRMFFG